MSQKQFCGQNLILRDFRYQELASADFQNAVLMACDFRGASLYDANFTNATLITCDFRGADLTQANLSVRTARSCSFQHATLSQVTWGDDPDNLGDPTCLYNARSPYLRCTVNPAGPCDGCAQFQALTL